MLNICIISLLDLKDLKFLLIYLDDSRICSNMAAEHLEHLQVIIEYPPPTGHEAAAALPGDVQLLPQFHVRYCSSPEAT
jgi:hypothetical protein